MSLQWTFIATFLYTEIFVVALLLLPVISAQRWQKIFRSRLLNAFRSYSNLYFNVFIVILLILFADSIRDVRKYSEPKEEHDLQSNPGAETALNMKLFRAQRNFYIAGFSLFLFLVLRRLVTLLSREAQVCAANEALKRQAESASNAAKQMMEEKEATQNSKNEKDEGAELEKKLRQSQQETSSLRSDLKSAEANLSAMKSQAQSTNKAHDHLLEEHRKLQEKLDQLEGKDGSRKDD
ncbi:hypothetical protein CAPTEDRAFT_172169 [Capitella teleta]|uniref:Endoplasmic reticulum transmembrane protein n=1 Tax=Capitella teleta TaxID=283909 RepID=R7UAN7_CAPTE|nr:hypothetical protein CAPTEDRAFT_172169 [Capitella teleta]|eukprot:ELU03196.1 hypothetical protein CAPTEDRAFT_172169 [Capitella teleta]